MALKAAIFVSSALGLSTAIDPGADAGLCPTSASSQGAALLQTYSAASAVASVSEKGSSFSVVFGDDNSCPDGYQKITDKALCRAALPFVESGDPNHFNGQEEDPNYPSGCYACSDVDGCEDGVWFNKHEEGAAYQGAKPICQKGFTIVPKSILFMGDSDVDYWVTSLEAVPGSYNVGIGGQTCGDVINELDFLLESFQPKQVVLVCGENDIAFGNNARTTFNRWKQVVGKIQAAGISVVVMGTKPEPGTRNLHSTYKEFDRSIRNYVKQKQTIDSPAPLVFVDVFPTFQALGNDDNLYDSDDLHMSPKGYALWDKWVQNALSNRFSCTIWMGERCTSQGPSVIISPAGAGECPTGFTRITTVDECRAASGLKASDNAWHGEERAEDWPTGCYYCGKHSEDCDTGTWFNKHATGSAKGGAHPYCKLA